MFKKGGCIIKNIVFLQHIIVFNGMQDKKSVIYKECG